VISFFKGIGYLVSTLSVLLLGAVSWNTASANPLMLSCLVGGMAASMGGMLLRWISHRRDQTQKTSPTEIAEASRQRAA
jgi:hypothetical protein